MGFETATQAANEGVYGTLTGGLTMLAEHRDEAAAGEHLIGMFKEMGEQTKRHCQTNEAGR